MNPSQFRAPEAGQLIQTIGGYLAFVPSPLPVQLTYTTDLVLALSEADAAIGELSGLARHLPNPQLLIAPYVRREAVLSSRIEGTKASLSDLLLEEVHESEAVDSADVQEVRNYVTALNYGVARLATLPLSQRLVRELHLRLMSGVRGEQESRENSAHLRIGLARRAVRLPKPPMCRLRSGSDLSLIIGKSFCICAESFPI